MVTFVQKTLLSSLFGLLFSVFLCAQSTEFIYGDLLPDAPELAKRGEYKVGVQTINLVHKNQLNVLKHKEGVTPTYDRPLTVEVWYPALVSPQQKEIVVYEEVMGNANDPKRPLKPFTFKGRSVRKAAAKKEEVPYPLVIISHGYTGSRYLLTYLAENLASKGYVVAAIDHTESTFRDAANFASTLYHRPLDQLFVLDEMDRLSQKGSGSFLSGLVDAKNTGLIGYSMGGYGALNATGAGFSKTALQSFKAMSGGCEALAERLAGSETYAKTQDERIKAVVAFAPWGMNAGAWDSTGLAGLTRPTFFVAGSEDDISKYEKGIKSIYEGARHANRYLLTYQNARHNVAPNPAPPEALAQGLPIDEYLRYADSVWDMRRINNINQHFVTAFLGIHLKKQDLNEYLQLKEKAVDGIWKGFKPRTSIGLEFRHHAAN
jgi:predicted dienelactone hydrolase